MGGTGFVIDDADRDRAGRGGRRGASAPAVVAADYAANGYGEYDPHRSALPAIGDAGGLLRLLQRTAGNNAVNAWLRGGTAGHVLAHTPAWLPTSALQRLAGDDGPGAQGQSDQTDDASGDAPDAGLAADEPLDYEVALSPSEPVKVAAADVPPEPGDYEPPADSNVAMAKREDGGTSPYLQRDDDDTPHVSADAQNQGTATIAGPTQAPWSFQATVIYRNLNLKTIQSLHLDLLHEPQASLTFDSQGSLTAQYGLTLLNWHYMPRWNKEIEVGLGVFGNTVLLPKISSLYNSQVQIEQHIVPWFSITASIGGFYVPPQGKQDGQFGATGGLGAVIHFDGIGKKK